MNKIIKLLFGVFLLVSVASLSMFIYDEQKPADKLPANRLSATNQSLVIDVASFNTEERLVPEGKAIFKGQTEVITLTYTIDVGSFNDGTYLLLSKVTNIRIDNQSNHHDLVKITINDELFGNKISITKNSIEVTVEIRLDEPKDRETYQAIAGKNITFQLLFEVI